MATEYKILYRDGQDWAEGYPNVTAASPKAAIREVVKDKQSQEGEFVAVPARSWKPVTVKVETKTALRFS